MFVANLENENGFVGTVNRTLRVTQFTMQTRLKVTVFERHHGRKLRIELTKAVKHNKSYLFRWTKLSFSVTPKQIPSYVIFSERGKVTDHFVMATKTNISCYLTKRLPNKILKKPISVKFEKPYALSGKEIQKCLWEGHVNIKDKLPLTLLNKRSAR